MSNIKCPGCGGRKAWTAKKCALCLGLRYGHGLSRTVEYRAWQTMRQRCTAPTNPAWPEYGGRGITMCARWLADVRNFVADMGNKPAPNLEIDRIDNDGGYWCGKCDECSALGRPANCRWVTRCVNDRNRRNNKFIEFRGERLTLVELSMRYGVPGDTLAFRLRKGWTVESALLTPVKPKAPNGSQALLCPKCKGKGWYGVRISVSPGWRRDECDCRAVAA